MKRVMHPFYKDYETNQVEVAGHGQALYFSPGVHRCGRVKDGVAFEFGNDGSWVVPLDELREMVRMAEEFRVKQGHAEGNGNG